MIDPTRNALLETIARTPSPTRSGRQKRAMIGYTIAAAWMIAVFAFASAYPHPAVRSAGSTAAVLLGLCALAVMFSAFLFARGPSPLGRSHWTLTAIAVAIPCGVLSWLSLGFLKPGPQLAFGTSQGAFGTPGAGGSFGFADPDTRLGFAYVMNKMDFHMFDDPREKALRDAVHRSIRQLAG